MNPSASVLAMAMLLAWPASLAAQPSEQVAADKAKKLLEQGVDAFQAEDYQRALNHFQQAFEQVPKDAIRFNIALCHERLGQPRLAVEQYEAVLESPELDAEGRARARGRLTQLRPRLAWLKIHGPEGTRAHVNAELSCDVPCELRVDPGTHHVLLRFAGQSEDKKISVTSGARGLVAWTQPTLTEGDTSEPQQAVSGSRWLTWTGVALAGVGTAGAIGFGIRTQQLSNDFEEDPRLSTADDGDLARTLTNVSLAVAVTGAVLVLVDQLLVKPRSGEHPPTNRQVARGGWVGASLQ